MMEFIKHIKHPRPTQAMKRQAPVFQAKVKVIILQNARSKLDGLPSKCHWNGMLQSKNPIKENTE
jgi:hypothetical protein